MSWHPARCSSSLKTAALRYCLVGSCITLLAAKAKPLNFSSRCRGAAQTSFISLLSFVPCALQSSTLKYCWARCLFSACSNVMLQYASALVCLGAWQRLFCPGVSFPECNCALVAARVCYCLPTSHRACFVP